MWNPDDVLHMDRPSTEELRKEINAVSWLDYVFIMFSGHGWYSSTDRDRIVTLRKGEEIASVELLKGARKRTLILDCCQKVHDESLMEKKAANFSALASKEACRVADPVKCHALFVDGIEKAASAIVRLTSCGIDEYSADDVDRGGRYNGSLIECTDDWFSAQSKERFGSGSATLSIVAAHEIAAEKTRILSGGSQNPGIEKSKTGPYFPIAVFA